MADPHIATTPSSHKARSSSVASSVFMEMSDTTWRIFVPTVSLLLVGRHYDVQLGTKPWLMLAGFVAGTFIAAVLIRNQLKRGGATK